MARRVIYKLISRLLFTKWHDKQDVALLSSNVSPEEPSRAAQRRKRAKGARANFYERKG